MFSGEVPSVLVSVPFIFRPDEKGTRVGMRYDKSFRAPEPGLPPQL